MSAPIYQLRNLTKEYGRRRVLAVGSLEIYEGEILAIVGPSGAGKSTLLRILNFLEPPSSGFVRFQGAEFGRAHAMPLSLRRQVTTVFQRPQLLDRSVWANVTYGLRLRGQRNSSHQVQATLRMVGLEGLARQRASALSGGEAQRVALARAMVIRPRVLLLDEPTANLDPYNVKLIERAAVRLNREHGTTLVLVTHNVFQAKRLAHRTALLLDGRVIEVADVHTFFHTPQDRRTAAFVRGEMIY